MHKNINILKIVQTAIKAGDGILKIYEKDFAVEYKADDSPLTEADKIANEIIIDELNKAYPEIPILSEESKEAPYEQRKKWDYFWLIDPLDGTKEFVKKNGEFTVNIALIHECKPVLGVITVPVKGTLYFGVEGAGSFKSSIWSETLSYSKQNQLIENSEKLPVVSSSRPYTVVGSRSHMSEETLEFITKKKEKHENVDILSIGSSLKLCMVAEGRADIYPRFGPTMEWDTAAGHAIAVAAGAKVFEPAENKPLLYNKENLLNPWFVVER